MSDTPTPIPTTPHRTPIMALARAADTSPAQLESLLITNTNPVVAINIAQRTDLDPRLVERLACDSRAAVRLRVAKNPLTPINLLEKLQDDSSAEVREAAKEALLIKSMHESYGNR